LTYSGITEAINGSGLGWIQVSQQDGKFSGTRETSKAKHRPHLLLGTESAKFHVSILSQVFAIKVLLKNAYGYQRNLISYQCCAN
jgi:hypothetical protein